MGSKEKRENLTEAPTTTLYKITDENAKRIVEKFGIEDDGEMFVIPTHFSDGSQVRHQILKRGSIVIGGKTVSVEDVIEAVQTFYPTVEKGKDLDVLEAVDKVRAKRTQGAKQ